MSADEMFEKLGYEIEKCANSTEYILGFGCDVKSISIVKNVDTNKNEIWIDDFHVITMQELKAINKKVEELGWLDE